MRIFIHNYKWSHSKKRKKIKKLLKEKKAVLLLKEHNGNVYWIYNKDTKFRRG